MWVVDEVSNRHVFSSRGIIYSGDVPSQLWWHVRQQYTASITKLDEYSNDCYKPASTVSSQGTSGPMNARRNAGRFMTSMPRSIKLRAATQSRGKSYTH